MPWLTLALGVVLAIGGGAAVVHGYPYMQIEFGWTEVIAGTTALSGGIVTIGIAAVLISLVRLRHALERAAPAHQVAVPHPTTVIAETLVPATPIIEVEKLGGKVASVDAQEAVLIDEEKPRDRVVAQRPDDPRQPQPAPRVPPIPEAVIPTIAGRYEFRGSSYVLFSDGTIEVDSGTEKRRFGSMDELKVHMAQESVGPDA